MLDSMNSFAHNVQVGKKQGDVDRVLKEFRSTPQEIVDLNRPEAHKFIRPLPDDPREINRLTLSISGRRTA